MQSKHHFSLALTTALFLGFLLPSFTASAQYWKDRALEVSGSAGLIHVDRYSKGAGLEYGLGAGIRLGKIHFGLTASLLRNLPVERIERERGWIAGGWVGYTIGNTYRGTVPNLRLVLGYQAGLIGENFTQMPYGELEALMRMEGQNFQPGVYLRMGWENNREHRSGLFLGMGIRIRFESIPQSSQIQTW